MTLKTILLIDDSEAEQFLYKSVIELYNPETEVISAYDGQEALEILNEEGMAVDAILLDINMPRMDGFKFLELYREQFGDRYRHVVIAMVTSSSQNSDKERAMSYEIVRKYFEKPLTMEHIKELAHIVEGNGAPAKL